MKNEDMLSISSHGIDFNVRIVRKGDYYGLHNSLKNEDDDILIEFYDARYDFTPGLGQFISRYRKTTLLGEDVWSANVDLKKEGLNLDAGIKDWYIGAEEMKEVLNWIEERDVNLEIKYKM